MILKFLDKSKGGGLASVMCVVEVAWHPSDQQPSERLEPTSPIQGDIYKQNRNKNAFR